jgi:hypothetical protein
MGGRRLSNLIRFFAILLAIHAGSVAAQDWDMRPRDAPRYELVMQLVVTCSSPEKLGPSDESKDGRRSRIWPIVGGRFVGKDIRGTVVPGGGDFPVMRPDGVVIVDALYRLKTDDGVTIIIHNKGLAYMEKPGAARYRLVPEFIAPQGKYDWLNKSIFLSTLVTAVPENMRLAKGSNENDRLIEVYRVL